MQMIDISLRPEIIGYMGSLPITNTMLTTMLVTGMLATLAIEYHWHSADVHPGIITKSIRVLCYELLHLTDSVTHDRSLTKKILPLLLTFFVFIIASNLIALLPGFLGSFFTIIEGKRAPMLRSPNSDLNVTLALALTSVGAIQWVAIREMGLIAYLKQFINFSSPIALILGFFEMISESLKIVSFAFRLFGNVFAGEVLLLVVGFLVPYILPLPFMLLEVFVGSIQAFVFTILTLTFVKLRTGEQKVEKSIVSKEVVYV